ncbi:MAG: hypothetical protein JWP89_234 [Schlesneria sp.]|nr:hypothetical protein [Schlesneria sp.]
MQSTMMVARIVQTIVVVPIFYFILLQDSNRSDQVVWCFLELLAVVFGGDWIKARIVESLLRQRALKQSNQEGNAN